MASTASLLRPRAHVQCRAAALQSISPQALSRRQAAVDLAAVVLSQTLLPRDAAALPSLFGVGTTDGMGLPAEPALIPR